MSIESIDLGRSVVESRAIHRFPEWLERGSISRDQIGIFGPQFLDRKIRSEQAAVGAEYLDCFFYDSGNMAGIVVVDERAESGKLGNNVWTRSKEAHSFSPPSPPLRRKDFQHTGMLKDEGDFWSSGGKLRGTFHLICENLEIEGPAVIGKVTDVFLQLRIARQVRAGGKTILRIFVPLQLHPQAAHAAIFGKAVKLRTDVVGKEIGIAYDPLWKAGLVDRLLHVGDFVLEPVLCPIRLNVNRLGHTGTGEVGQEFADRIVTPDRLVWAKDARLHGAVEPRQVATAPNVMMCVNDSGHTIPQF